MVLAAEGIIVPREGTVMYAPAVGDKVRVQTATGRERVLRVAELGAGVIYVTTEAEYQKARAEQRQPVAYIGYPAEDVGAA
jgi:hypothetical protein